MESEEKTHCAFGPSTLPARAVCPFWDSAGGGADAESGTRAHACVETILLGENDENVFSEATEDENARAEWGAAEIEKLRDRYCEPHLYIYPEKEVCYVPRNDDERRGIVGDLDSEREAFDGLFGTCDAHAFDGRSGTLLVADFKTYATEGGGGKYTPQLMAYAMMIASALQQHGGNEIKRCVGAVVAAGDRTVGVVEFTLKEARETLVRILRPVRNLRGKNAVYWQGIIARHPSEWCKHCKHNGACPATSAIVTSAAESVEAVGANAFLSRPLAERMVLCTVLEAVVEATKKEVRETLERGEAVRGEINGAAVEYALAERRGFGRLVDLKGLLGTLAETGAPTDKIAEIVKVSKSAAEALLREVAPDLSARDRKDVIAPFFEEGRPTKVIKRIS